MLSRVREVSNRERPVDVSPCHCTPRDLNFFFLIVVTRVGRRGCREGRGYIPVMKLMERIYNNDLNVGTIDKCWKVLINVKAMSAKI